MSAKIDYLKQELTSLQAQLNADNGKGDVLKLIGKASGILKTRSETGEVPVRANVAGLVSQIHAAADAYNSANTLSVPDVSVILDNFDAASDPE